MLHLGCCTKVCEILVLLTRLLQYLGKYFQSFYHQYLYKEQDIKKFLGQIFQMYGTFNRVTQNSTFNSTGPLIGFLEQLVPESWAISPNWS